MRKRRYSERFWAIGLAVMLLLAIGSGVYVVEDLAGTYHKASG